LSKEFGSFDLQKPASGERVPETVEHGRAKFEDLADGRLSKVEDAVVQPRGEVRTDLVHDS
jgi:hypothetical protein